MIPEYRLKQLNDYQKMEEQLREVDALDHTPSILLQSCCAPCSSHVISVLSPHFDITILYYNPNIEPYEEYLKRKEEEIRFIGEYPASNKLDIIDCDYDNDKFHEVVKGLEDLKEGGNRCFICYELRLLKTAKMAKELGYDYFATTLSVSPYKNSKKLNEIGLKLSEEYDVKYLISDFKKKNGYKHSIELSKEYNLYRQDYCGCIYSRKDRE
jgi:predicted adenine nucleotide alpha hydrolase (AANH) superfamily ATPase